MLTSFRLVTFTKRNRISANFVLVDLYRWSNDWLMLFNTDKCKVMHLGNTNPCVKYDFGGHKRVSVLENDLGILITKDLNARAQCSRVARTAYKTDLSGIQLNKIIY